MRLNKYLAHCGVASRRKCDQLIQDGKISINGRNNAGNGDVSIAEFIVGGSNTPEFKCFGDITAFASSDATLKENITPISNAVDKVLSISGNTFTWNEKSIYNEGKFICHFFNTLFLYLCRLTSLFN